MSEKTKSLILSVAFVIYAPGDKSRILTVQGKYNDPDLPGVWRLPATPVLDGETYPDAIRRAGRDKLGVSLDIIGPINSGRIERQDFHLYMKEFEVKVISGTPYAPQNSSNGSFQYQRCELATPERLIEAAELGSLCSRLFLSYKGIRQFNDYR